ncbi:MAG: phosphoenolpyruvate--protein phosphotransferase [Spartobacteria bacterium AMD-G5]|nr:MAG: phosphoenolpyruvate--protein phosphotransferase [Spartobacteria bacterium AMD-G5]
MDAPLEEKVEKRFQGVPVAQGIAHFPALVYYTEDEEILPRDIPPQELSGEIARFEAALISTRIELLDIQRRIVSAIGSKDASIFDAHLLVVEDRTLIDEVLRGLERDHCNVEHVFQQVVQKYCRTLESIDDPYLRERVVDIQDVARRVIRNLLGKAPLNPAAHAQQHIVIAHNLSPSDTAQFDRSLVYGFVTEIGSKTSHTAILARSLEIPAIVGMQGITQHLRIGEDILIDGYKGLLIVNPSRETLIEYGRIEQEKEEVAERLEQIRETVSTTRDGRHIALSANIDLPDDLGEIAAQGAEGVGLFRTEFLFLNREESPSEDEQYEHYRHAAESCLPHALIIRTLDIGGDKVASSLAFEHEENPFLGCRAIRYCLEHPAVFKTQLRAILRAAGIGHVKIMYPMISGIEELRRANQILEECKQELASAGIPFNPFVEVGIMIEIPSAVLVADHLAREVRFFSIGTNDLIQYSIAVDRLNDRIAHLYNPTHPSILRMIKMTVDAGKAHGIWTGVCGEMASDIQLTPLLIGLGVDELSASTALVPRIKKAVQSLDSGACESLVREVLAMDDSNAILEKSRAMAREHYADLID